MLEDARNVKGREETDTVDIVDEIRYYISSFVLTYSDMEEANEKLRLIDDLLEELDIEAWTYADMCLYVCEHACVCVYMRLCLCVCTHVYLHANSRYTVLYVYIREKTELGFILLNINCIHCYYCL